MTPRPAARRWLRHLLDAALGVVVTAVLLGLLEVSLAVAGVDVDPPVELSRGFDPDVEYVVPDPEIPGAWRTLIDTPAIDDMSISPPGDAFRLLLFGGSNTRGLPHARFEELLENGRPERGFEVINIGRPGYGTGRVATLFEQAVERFEPDAVLIYAGHNEFVERSFRLDLDAVAAQPGGLLFADLAQRTRTARLLRDLSMGRRPARQSQDEAWRREYAKFEQLTYADTREEFERYEENLRRMADFARERDVRLALCTVVYNRWSPPFVSSVSADLDAGTRREVEQLYARAGRRLPAWCEPLVTERVQRRVTMRDWGRTRGSVTPPDRGLRPLVGPFAGREPAFFDGEWSDRVHALYQALERAHAGAAEDERELFTEVAATLDQVLERDPRHPGALFLRGLVAWVLGQRDGSIAAWFEDAGRYDRAPRRANALVNDHVRAVARDFEDVLFIDVDAAAMTTDENGLVGWELMGDHCHLNPGGRLFAVECMAAAILDAWFAFAEEGR